MSASLNLLEVPDPVVAEPPAEVLSPRVVAHLFDTLQHRVKDTGGPVTGELDGYRFASHFQPIYSLSHGRVVGHEALLRATFGADTPVPPPQVFDVDDRLTLFMRDWLARMVHVSNFNAAGLDDQWLFLNVHPSQFTCAPGPRATLFLDRFREAFGLPPQRMVLEVLENMLSDDSSFEAMVQLVRERGCLVALDDFGAGHSNFDRVWRLRPEIVKLDRSLVAKAATERPVRRMLAQIVSLLHECGALVLMEGVETPDEAFIALECDADLVQGYLFGRPQARLMPSGHRPDALASVWQSFETRWRDEQRASRDHIAPYMRAIDEAGTKLAQGESLDTACQAFLALPDVEACYRLGDDGRQIGTNLWAAPTGRTESDRARAFEPLRETQGARWERRPYFRRAMNAVGKPQVTRPYRTLHGGHLSVTLSMAVSVPGSDALQVVCGDVRWDNAARG